MNTALGHSRRGMRANYLRWMLFWVCFFTGPAAFGQQTGNKEFLLQLHDFRGAIQWEQSTDLVAWTAIAGADTGALKLKPVNTTYYRAKITAPGCSPVYSGVKAAFFDGKKLIGAKLVHGKVALPAGAAAQAGTLKVHSFLETRPVQADGSFQVLLPDSVQEDVLLIANQSDEAVMLGQYVGEQEEYLVSAESTAAALLMLYPTQKPIAAAEKPALLGLYRKQPEFAQLVDQVAALQAQNLPLFSDQHTALIQSLSLLVRKDLNKTGLRTTGVDPVYIRSAGNGSVAITSNADFSYTAQVYRRKDQAPIGPAFNVAGAMVRGSAMAASLVQSWRGPVNLDKKEVLINLKDALKAEPGEYVIHLRSGFAKDNSPEDAQALKQNLSELAALFFANFIGFTMVLEDECLQAIIDTELNAMNPFAMEDAVREGKVFETFLLPILKEVSKAGVNCLSANQAAHKLLGMADLVDKTIPLAWYAGDWALSEASINGCQFLSQDYETSDCFVVQTAATLKEQYLPGDTVEVKVKTIGNKAFYPYTDNPAGFRHFVWLVTKGAGGFAPDQAINAKARTDVNGMASIKWVLSCRQEVNALQAVVTDLGEDLFVTRTKVPKLKVVKTGDFQPYLSESLLPDPLSFVIQVDDNPFQLLPLDKVDIKWEVKGGGSLQEAPENYTSAYMAGKKWKLGPGGEQVVTATITSKCGEPWPIEGNPVVFRSVEQYLSATINGQEWRSATTVAGISSYTNGIGTPTFYKRHIQGEVKPVMGQIQSVYFYLEPQSQPYGFQVGSYPIGDDKNRNLFSGLTESMNISISVDGKGTTTGSGAYDGRGSGQVNITAVKDGIIEGNFYFIVKDYAGKVLYTVTNGKFVTVPRN